MQRSGRHFSPDRSKHRRPLSRRVWIAQAAHQVDAHLLVASLQLLVVAQFRLGDPVGLLSLLSLLADKDVAAGIILRHSLQPTGDVHRVADGRVRLPQMRADEADHRFASVDADADAQFLAAQRLAGAG